LQIFSIPSSLTESILSLSLCFSSPREQNKDRKSKEEKKGGLQIKSPLRDWRREKEKREKRDVYGLTSCYEAFVNHFYCYRFSLQIPKNNNNP
jgi:hypothetical protein